MKSTPFEEDPSPVRPKIPTDYYETIPPLTCCMNAVLSVELLAALAALLAKKPMLLRHGRSEPDLHKQAFWKIPCPDGDMIELTGYRSVKDPGPATEMMLTGYITSKTISGARTRHKADRQTQELIDNAVRKLLAHHGLDTAALPSQPVPEPDGESYEELFGI